MEYALSPADWGPDQALDVNHLTWQLLSARQTSKVEASDDDPGMPLFIPVLGPPSFKKFWRMHGEDSPAAGVSVWCPVDDDVPFLLVRAVTGRIIDATVDRVNNDDTIDLSITNPFTGVAMCSVSMVPLEATIKMVSGCKNFTTNRY